MKVLKRLQTGRFLAFTVVILLAVVAGSWGFVSIVYADEVPTAPYTLQTGYLDFSYGADVFPDHTANRPESKLWWNDGYWWATMWNDTVDRFHIYRLNWGSQTWHDTGVPLDDRPESRADILWDEDGQKLYVASYFQYDNPSTVNDPINWARLYRLTYDEATESYSLDSGFPVTEINQDKTNSLVLDQDVDGTLWSTYVSRPHGSSEYQVFINASDGEDETWHTPYSLADAFPVEATVAIDDVSSIVAFDNTVAVMWTNQLTGNLNFAIHDAGSAWDEGWTRTTVPIVGEIDDHLEVKANSAGQLFATIKTTSEVNGEPLIALVTRDTSGQFSFHPYSLVEDQDTRAILAIDEGTDQVYVFVTGKPGGSMICYKAAAITNPLANMSFAPGDCGTNFIADQTYDRVDSATTSKHVVNDVTGLVVLASDDHNGNVYVHNVIGDPPPVITNRSPGFGATNVPLDAAITVTFSKNMNPATMTAANITLESSGAPVAGSVSYDPNTRTATFTLDELLQADTEYTLTITTDVQDMGGQPLYEAETWSFITGDELLGAGSMIYMPVMVRP